MNLNETPNNTRARRWTELHTLPDTVSIPPDLSPDEMKALLHDLAVRQLELEHQNRELLQTRLLLEKSREELARLYHQAPMGYLTLNRNGTIERCNSRFAEMVGVPEDELANRALADLLDTADRDIFLTRLTAFYQQPEETSLDLHFPGNGSSTGFYGCLTAVRETDATRHRSDGEARLLVVIQDVSEQRLKSLIRTKTETSMRSHDLFVSTLLETMPIPIFYKDAQSRYMGCNQAFTSFTGLDRQQVIGKTVHEIAPPDIAAQYDEMDQQLLANPGTQSYEWKVRGADNRIRTVVFHKATFCNAEGQLTGIVGAILDITELKELQTTMQQAKEAAEQASRAKSEFLTNMSHELRTPMNGVIGMAELLAMSELTDEQQTFVSAITQSGQNLIRIIGDILDLAKIEAEKIELEQLPFSPRTLVDQAIALMLPLAQEKGLQLTSRLQPDLPDLLSGDAGRLNQVLLNLVGNAIKFTRQGSVTISAQTEPLAANKVMLSMSITDTGIGIPQSSLHRLFTPFSQIDNSCTRSFGGTGLGLAISKQLIELMGGSICVESSAGTGSTFSICLPLETATKDVHEPHRTTARNPASRATGSHRILLVEDNALNQKVLEIMLSKLGYQTGLATHGEEALTMLQKEVFDLVLMDCSMPVMDGYLATQKIRDPATGLPNPAIPIIAMTARAMHGDREKCLEAGMNDYLSKPIYCETLVVMLNRWLDKKLLQ